MVINILLINYINVKKNIEYLYQKRTIMINFFKLLKKILIHFFWLLKKNI